MSEFESFDSIYVWVGAAVFVHIVIASLQSKDAKWVLDMSRRETLFWHLVIWFVPIIGVAAARKRFNLPTSKGEGRSNYDDSLETQDIFEK